MRFFLVKPDFEKQKQKIEELITNAAKRKYHIVMYYPKYHCKPNHIEQF